MDLIRTKRFGYLTNSWLERFISYRQNEFTIQGSIDFPNENQQSIVIKINADGEILDSVSIEKFQMMVYSPLQFYIKVQQADTAHIHFSKIQVDKLFDKNQ